MDVVTYDVVVVGGSLGGVAAALRAGEIGASVCLLEASTWLGGQYTGQGVCKPDENRFVDTVGSTAAYRAFKHAVRLYYRQNFKLSAAGASQPTFNPGGSYPGFAVEPKVGSNVLRDQLLAAPNVHLRLQTTVTSAILTDDAVTSVVATGPDGKPVRFDAKYFLDATDLGDLLPLAGVEFRLGAEARAEFGEADAPPQARPGWIQPITMPLALERRPAGENHTIAPPADYAHLKATQNYTIVDGYIDSMFVPGRDMWSYRRFIAAANFADPAHATDLSMLNTGANDYQGGTLPTGSALGDAAVIAAARAASVGYLYWLQTECPRDGGGRGYPELRPRSDVFGTPDATSALPYVRESRRIEALATVVQSDLDSASNAGPRGKNYRDACGIGLYGGLDIHGLRSAELPQSFIDIKPFQIPLGALIPKRVTNVLAACKNIGVTHVANGAYRLHPVEWNVGEAAGALAAFALARGVLPRSVPGDDALLRDYQLLLLDRGVPVFWWTDVAFGTPYFDAVQMLGVRGIVAGYDDMRFGASDVLTENDRVALAADAGVELPSSGDLTRGQAAQLIGTQLALVGTGRTFA